MRRASRRSRSGQVQWSTYLLLLLLVAGGYLAAAVFPAYADNYTVKQELSGITNQAWRRMGKEEMHKLVMEKLAKIGSHLEQEPGGPVIEKPGLLVRDEDVEVTCTDQSQDCSSQEGEVTIQVRYSRVMPLPYWKGKSITLKFSPSTHDTLHPAVY